MKYSRFKPLSAVASFAHFANGTPRRLQQNLVPVRNKPDVPAGVPHNKGAR